MLAMTEAPAVDFLFTSGKANRFNTRGVWCVYFAEDDATAEAEYGRHYTGQQQPYVTYFAEVKLRRVLDLKGSVRQLTILIGFVLPVSFTFP